jgi:EmrB/QacA subfamily drug resistance transporter
VPDGEASEEPRRGSYDSVSIDAPGAEEVSIVAWPLLLRDRITARVGRSSHFPQLVLVAALYGLFAVGFTITLLAVSVPAMADDLDSTNTTLTWVITGPLLAFGVVGPVVGKLGDLHGHKRVYLIGLALSALFSLAMAAAWNASSLIAFRVFGAAAGAACGPASMAIIHSVFPPERRVQAMGYWSMVNAGGPVLGVVAGGPVVEALSWRVVFLVQAPLIMFGVVLAGLVLPETVRRAEVRLDVRGALLLGFSVTSLLFALNRGPVLGWSSPWVLGSFAAAPALGGLFVWWEGRVEHPLIRLDYLRRRNVAAPIIAQSLTNFAYMGSFVITPLLLSDVFGYGETRIGLLSVSRPLTFALVAPLAGMVALRVGERAAGVAGASAVAFSMLLMTQLSPDRSDLLVMLALGVAGAGLGTSSPSMAATVANAVDQTDLGIAGATQQLMAQVAVVAGIQLMQTVQAATVDSAGLLGSYHSAYALAGGVCVLGIVAATFVRRSPRAAEPDLALR